MTALDCYESVGFCQSGDEDRVCVGVHPGCSLFSQCIYVCQPILLARRTVVQGFVIARGTDNNKPRKRMQRSMVASKTTIKFPILCATQPRSDCRKKKEISSGVTESVLVALMIQSQLYDQPGCFRYAFCTVY